MVLSGEVQIRRSCSLRKPSVSTRAMSQKTTTNSEGLIQGLMSKILLLDEAHFKTERGSIEKDLLASLIEKALTTKLCLQIFLDTAWKDRNRRPIIAEMFHNIAQEHDDESSTGLTALLEKSCNDLLNILTLLGKPEVNDLSIVTLLANLHRLEDLPEEHQEGVESYLVDIAKAFWPYFVPQKREVWDNELVADAICDVFHTVGKVLEKKCPINMERTFNKITTMLFPKNTISQYTRLRLMEVKECRAAGWSLPDSARDYYRAAFLKYPRRTSNSSLRPISPSSPSSSDDDDVFPTRSAENSPTTETKRAFLTNDKYEVLSVHSNLTTNSEKSHQPLVIRIKPKPLPELNNNIKQLGNNCTTVTCRDSDPTSKLCSDEPNESNLQASKDFQERWESDENTSESPRDETATHNTSCDDSLLYYNAPNPDESISSSSTPDRSSQTESLSSPFSSTALSNSSSEEKSPNNSGGFSRESAFSRGFSCPETSSPPSCRHNSFSNDSTSGETSHQRRTPFYRGGFHRSLSESSTVESTYSKLGQNTNGSDSTGFGQPDGGRFSSGRPNYNRQPSNYNRWRSNLEFPVKEMSEGEELDTGSRLYLLSFATTPAALERPVDLTLTPEVEAEKEWLQCVILDEPTTVLDRFGQ